MPGVRERGRVPCGGEAGWRMRGNAAPCRRESRVHEKFDCGKLLRAPFARMTNGGD